MNPLVQGFRVGESLEAHAVPKVGVRPARRSKEAAIGAPTALPVHNIPLQGPLHGEAPLLHEIVLVPRDVAVVLQRQPVVEGQHSFIREGFGHENGGGDVGEAVVRHNAPPGLSGVVNGALLWQGISGPPEV